MVVAGPAAVSRRCAAASARAARPARGPARPGGRRPARQQANGRGERGGQGGGPGEVAGGPGLSGGPVADQHSSRSVVPVGRDHLGLVHAQPDDEVRLGQQRPFHGAAGDQAACFSGGVRHDTARPVGVQHRDPAADHGGPDSGRVRARVRAKQQDRPPGLAQRGGQRRQITGLRVTRPGTAGCLILHAACEVRRGPLVHQRDHRPGWRGQGLADRLRGRLGGPVTADGHCRLRYRPAQGTLLQPLVTDPAGFGGPHRVGDNHEGEPVQRRVRDPVDRAGEAGSPGDQHRSRCPGQVGAGGGHDGGRGLGVGEHEAQPGRGGGADHIQVRAATRHAEHHPGTGDGQRGHDGRGPGRDGAACAGRSAWPGSRLTVAGPRLTRRPRRCRSGRPGRASAAGRSTGPGGND